MNTDGPKQRLIMVVMPRTDQQEMLSAAQIIDYNQRVAPIFAEKAMAKNLIRQVKEAYPFGSTPSEIMQSLEGLYARDYYNNHPCFAP
ncbi:hypothetical protein [Microcoleus sp.]|uniref:hypothetical protein n=1 Tax=Microcoleus sp. TaxID=44472 RepID=UPI00403EB64C